LVPKTENMAQRGQYTPGLQNVPHANVFPVIKYENICVTAHTLMWEGNLVRESGENYISHSLMSVPL
jgi:hypothetical protein